MALWISLHGQNRHALNIQNGEIGCQAALRIIVTLGRLGPPGFLGMLNPNQAADLVCLARRHCVNLILCVTSKKLMV